MPTFQYTTPGPNFSIGRPWTPAVKMLIIVNTAIFLLSSIFRSHPLWPWLTLQVPEVLVNLRLWELGTYFFLHNDFWHLAFNLLALWMFGSDVEATLGTRWFYLYYFACGLGAGLFVALLGSWAGEHSQTLGSSGAIFGVLMAFGILFANRVITLLLFLILPLQMKAKTMVIIFGAIELVAGVGNAFGRVSHLAHLSGLLVGLIFFMLVWPDKVPSLNPWPRLRLWWAGRHVRRIDPEEEVDAILDKISRQGIHSLSTRERSILNDAARRRNN